MTPKQEAAMRQALEALEWASDLNSTAQNYRPLQDSISALREALAEPVQEPGQEPVYWEVRCTAHPRWMRVDEQRFDEFVAYGWEGQRLYTTPPQRKPLTDEEIQEAVTKAARERKLSWMGFSKDEQGQYTIPVLSPYHYELVRVIEAKLKEKNT